MTAFVSWEVAPALQAAAAIGAMNTANAAMSFRPPDPIDLTVVQLAAEYAGKADYEANITGPPATVEEGSSEWNRVASALRPFFNSPSVAKEMAVYPVIFNAMKARPTSSLFNTPVVLALALGGALITYYMWVRKGAVWR